jgi:hypothetical protein
MGGGSKEKLARLSETNRCDAECQGLRQILALLFLATLVFLVRFSNDVVEQADYQSLALAAKLQKERQARVEARRQAEEASMQLQEVEEKSILSRDDSVPPWVTPRAPKRKQTKKASAELEEEWGEEDAEVRTGAWRAVQALRGLTCPVRARRLSCGSA